MVYLLICAVLFFLSLKGVCGKKTSILVRDTGDTFLFNLLRMLFCIAIGAFLVLQEGVANALAVEWGMLVICLLSGIANAAFLVGWILAVRQSRMVTIDVTLTLGSLLPALLCAALFGESISAQKMIGFALIVLASVILAGKGEKSGKGGGLGSLLLPLTAALGDGLTSFCQQLYKHFYTEGGSRTHGVFYPKSIFHFYTYVFASLTLLAVFVVYTIAVRAKAAPEEKPRLSRHLTPLRQAVPYILIMAICLFLGNYLQTVVANDYAFPSQVLYPVIKGGTLITVNITAMIFFGERITRRSALGSLVALGGIIVMNLL